MFKQSLLCLGLLTLSACSSTDKDMKSTNQEVATTEVAAPVQDATQVAQTEAGSELAAPAEQEQKA